MRIASLLVMGIGCFCYLAIAAEPTDDFVQDVLKKSAIERAKVYKTYSEGMDWQLKTRAPDERRASTLLAVLVKKGDLDALIQLEEIIPDRDKYYIWHAIACILDDNPSVLKALQYWATIHPNEVKLMRFGPEPEDKLQAVLGDLKLRPEQRENAADQLSLLGTKKAITALEKFINDKTKIYRSHKWGKSEPFGAIVQECIQNIKERLAKNDPLVNETRQIDTPKQNNAQNESPEWANWLLQLPIEEQRKQLANLEKSCPAHMEADWKAVRVAAGPGTDSGDYFPCKVLTNFKPVFEVLPGVCASSLRFNIYRTGSSIATTIWIENEVAMFVNWTTEQIIPIKVASKVVGKSVLPEYLSQNFDVSGESGKLKIIFYQLALDIPWKKGLRAYPLVTLQEDPIAFCKVRLDAIEQNNPFQGILCLNIPRAIEVLPFKNRKNTENLPRTHYFRILGEIKTPTSLNEIWCLYEKDKQVLLVVADDWNWIAMLDLSKPKQPIKE